MLTFIYLSPHAHAAIDAADATPYAYRHYATLLLPASVMPRLMLMNASAATLPALYAACSRLRRLRYASPL